jgi:O-antigen ligase
MRKLSKEDIFFGTLLSFIFFIPLSESFCIKLLILSLVLSLFLIKSPHWRGRFLPNAWDLLLFYAVLLIGLAYTENLSDGVNVLEKSLSFLVIPILFARIQPMDKTRVNKLFIAFTAGVIVASCICLGYAVWNDVFGSKHDGYYYDQFTAIIDSHPTYMAYYVCFSIVFLLYLISYEATSSVQRVMIVAGIVFLTGILMLTAGRSTYISMLMMSSFFFLKLLFEPSPVRRKLQGISLTVLVLALILLQSPYTQRVLPFFLSGRPATLTKMKGDSWDRLFVWKAAIKASPNLMAGVGTGDYSSAMNNYYMEHNLPEYASVNFNSHNQFIQILLSNGVAGLLALMLILLRPIYLAVQRQNIFGMLAFFPFLIYGISEVFLGRFQGIVFFVLLHQIFVTYFIQASQNPFNNTSE